MNTNPPDGGGPSIPGALPAAVAHPPSDPDVANKPPTNEAQTSANEALLKAIEKIPYVGPWLVWVIKKFGWNGFILFMLGGIVSATIVLALIFFGKLPQWLVSPAYSTVTSESTAGQPLKGDLSMVELNDLSKMEMWLLDYRQFLLGSAATLDHGGVKLFELKDPMSNPTSSSKWYVDLASDLNYVIQDGRGFRVTKTGLVQPLTVVDSPTHFNVPPCEQGDTLRAIVVYQRRQDAKDGSPPVFLSSGK
jgi:hypothetical protein